MTDKNSSPARADSVAAPEADAEYVLAALCERANAALDPRN